MKKIHIFRCFVCLILSLAIICCASCNTPAVKDNRVSIVTTSLPLLTLVNGMIRSDIATAQCILPAGTDSHEFDPTISDINNVSNAIAFVYCGDALEAWANDLFKSAEGDAVRIDVSDGITLLYQESDHEDTDVENNHSHSHGADQHIWTSPRNMLKMAETIYNAIAEIKVSTQDGQQTSLVDPDAYKMLVDKLYELDKQIEELAIRQEEISVPLFFGDSFAFLYLMKDYGFEYVSAYPGCSDEVEPSISRISEVTEQMIENSAGVVFKAEMSNGKIAQSLAEITNATVLTLHSCHNLSKDEEKAGHDYFSLMQENLTAIDKALH